MKHGIRRLSIGVLLLPLAFSAAYAQLRGHGGPVRALAISPDGARAVSGSFDASVIRWSLARNVAEQVMRFHDGAVNAVAYLKDGRIVTAGADAHIAIWTPAQQKPDKVLDGHTGPVASLAVSPDGTMLASASWDHSVRLWPLSSGTPRVLEGNAQNVNGVSFSPDGKNVVSAGYDTTLRIWPLAGGGEVVRNLPSPLKASQRRIIRSAPPVNKVWLSGKNATDHTGNPGPTNVCASLRVLRSITATEPRMPAAATRLPSGEMAIAMIGVGEASTSASTSPFGDRK